MLNTFVINKNDIGKELRFEPNFYYYSKILKEINIKKGIRFSQLGDIADKISDGEHSHIPRQKIKGVRYLYGRNIKEGSINFDPISDIPYISETNYNNFKRIHLKDNDILLTIVGTIGKSAIYNKKNDGTAGIPRHIAKITLDKKSKITPEFITAFFRTKVGKWQLYNITTGNIQPLLSIKNIKTLDIPKVTDKLIDEVTKLEKKQIELNSDSISLIEEAKEIFLDNVKIENKNINKKYYSEKISSFVNDDLLTPAYLYPKYISPIEQLSKSFETLNLGDIVDIKKGDETGSDNYIDYIKKKDTDVPFVRTSDIVNYEVDFFPDYYIPKEINEELNQKLLPGDILYTNDGKIGLVAMLTEEDNVIIQSHIKRLRLNNYSKKHNITREYLFLVLTTKRIARYQAKRFTVIQSTIPTISNRILNIKIPVIQNNSIKKITEIIKEAFDKKNERKKILKKSLKLIENFFGKG